MTEIRRSALLPYSAELIYALINDVRAYPSFMDGCTGAEVLHQDQDIMEARLDLARAGIRLSFTTRNTLEPPRRVGLQLVDGPFESLEGEWLLLPLNETACKVTLQLRFSLAGRLIGAATRQLFNSVANNLVDAVVKRAKELHGK